MFRVTPRFEIKDIEETFPPSASPQARRTGPMIIFMWMSSIQKSFLPNSLKWKLGLCG